MDALKIIQKYYKADSIAYKLLINHSQAVAKKALKVAKRLEDSKIDFVFIENAALLHDIGIYMTCLPEIGCFGSHPYILHGYLGRGILEKEGFPAHALVCERHVGMGLTIQDIERNNFPLPKRDMVPYSLEEKIICFADKFYSKEEKNIFIEKPIGEVRKIISHYGSKKLSLFDEWLIYFREIDQPKESDSNSL